MAENNIIAQCAVELYNAAKEFGTPISIDLAREMGVRLLKCGLVVDLESVADGSVTLLYNPNPLDVGKVVEIGNLSEFKDSVKRLRLAFERACNYCILPEVDEDGTELSEAVEAWKERKGISEYGITSDMVKQYLLEAVDIELASKKI